MVRERNVLEGKVLGGMVLEVKIRDGWQGKASHRKTRYGTAQEGKERKKGQTMQNKARYSKAMQSKRRHGTVKEGKLRGNKGT